MASKHTSLEEFGKASWALWSIEADLALAAPGRRGTRSASVVKTSTTAEVGIA